MSPDQNDLIERGMRHSECFGQAKIVDIQHTMRIFEEQFADILPKLRSDFFDGFLAGYVYDYSRITPFEPEAYRYGYSLSLIHISEPTRRYAISYAVFCL